MHAVLELLQLPPELVRQHRRNSTLEGLPAAQETDEPPSLEPSAH
eukprot:CAMPEP_0170649580 /NCGR_PEP_ID=MMETSP0224-20130122/45362_1 /TAXON_ID=285029 /ORGANISM="Togula jolla, Strain CCCM 725" /LENGTH=44 /DNA_ID= /DNA_START= /DNA_END= /DNA_ORIENTATION=